MKREDWNMLKSLDSLGVDIADFIAMPLLIVPDVADDSDYSDYMKEHIFGSDISSSNVIQCVSDYGPFDEFLSYTARRQAPHSEIPMGGLTESLTAVQVKDDCVVGVVYRMETFFFGGKHGTKQLLTKHVIKFQPEGYGIISDEVLTKGYTDQSFLQKTKAAESAMAHLTGFLKFAYECDMYPVYVRKTKKSFKDRKDEKSKQPWKSSALPKIIYLNALPVEVDSPSTIGMGAPKRPHQRRGCFKTLRAERYRNHPLFQVPKAIYCRPAFVGPKEAVVAGNRYSIITGA